MSSISAFGRRAISSKGFMSSMGSKSSAGLFSSIGFNERGESNLLNTLNPYSVIKLAQRLEYAQRSRFNIFLQDKH
jgi:hypothetical protein